MSLTTKQREQLYDSEVEKARALGRGDHPLCNICIQSIFTGQKWHESHNPLLPKALGGLTTGIAHERCNLRHAHKFDVPLIAKVKRRRQKHIGAYRSSSRPMPGTFASGIKLHLNNSPPTWRDSGRPLWKR